MSDRDYLYGHVCAHGSLARSCQVCDLEDLLDEVQEALTWAEAPVRYDGSRSASAPRWSGGTVSSPTLWRTG